MILTILFIFVILVLTLCHIYIHYGRKEKLVNQIPGPKTIPLLGNVHQFLLPTDKLWTAQRNLCMDYYPISRIWLGGMCGIGICHPDYAQIILSSTKHIEKSLIYTFLRPWLGTGLLTSTGEKWHKRRKMLTPAFHFHILQGFVEVFVKEAEKMVDYLKKDGDESIHNIEPVLTKFTLNAICETAMGTSLEKINDSEKYRAAVREVGDFTFFRILRPWFHFDWIFNLSPSGIRYSKVIKTLHTFSTKIIRDRRKYHEETFTANGKSEIKNEEVFGRKKRMAMLDILISEARANSGSISEEGIREEVDTFIFEGHDTTSMALIFAVALLAEHTKVQKLAREEIREVMEETGGKMSMREINRFVYLEMCIKESLRLYPSVATITRVIDEDLKLKNYVVPAGSNIHLYIFDLHRDPNFWPDPNKFNPDRFLPENSKNRHPFSYIPFSGGPRNCIGQKFAMLELKTFLAYLLYNFELEAIDFAHEVVLIQDLVIRPKNPVRVKFRQISN